MNAEDYQQMMAKGMTERQLQDAVIRFAKSQGWMVYHTHDSRRSAPGFPDLVLAHLVRGVLWRELKTERGRVSPAQKEWMDRLNAAGQDAKVWRPIDWMSDRIVKELMA